MIYHSNYFLASPSPEKNALGKRKLIKQPIGEAILPIAVAVPL
jgi:hypothetical protein